MKYIVFKFVYALRDLANNLTKKKQNIIETLSTSRRMILK